GKECAGPAKHGQPQKKGALPLALSLDQNLRLQSPASAFHQPQRRLRRGQCFQGAGEPLPRLKFSPADSTLGQMFFHLALLLGVQRAGGSEGQSIANLIVLVHVQFRTSAFSSTARRKCFNARCRRVFTVPSGRRSTAAISSSLISSSKRSVRT